MLLLFPPLMISYLDYYRIISRTKSRVLIIIVMLLAVSTLVPWICSCTFNKGYLYHHGTYLQDTHRFTSILDSECYLCRLLPLMAINTCLCKVAKSVGTWVKVILISWSYVHHIAMFILIMHHSKDIYICDMPEQQKIARLLLCRIMRKAHRTWGYFNMH